MGATPWTYFVPFQRNFDDALGALRQREFEAGRYHRANSDLPIIIEETTPAPGKQHDTIEAAIMDAAPDGTSSILDILGISEEPGPAFAHRLNNEDLEAIFGTTRPTRELVCKELAMFDSIDRGEAVCFLTYDESGSPSAICFAGYSFD